MSTFLVAVAVVATVTAWVTVQVLRDADKPAMNPPARDREPRRTVATVAAPALAPRARVAQAVRVQRLETAPPMSTLVHLRRAAAPRGQPGPALPLAGTPAAAAATGMAYTLPARPVVRQRPWHRVRAALALGAVVTFAGTVVAVAIAAVIAVAVLGVRAAAG